MVVLFFDLYQNSKLFCKDVKVKLKFFSCIANLALSEQLISYQLELGFDHCAIGRGKGEINGHCIMLFLTYLLVASLFDP